MYMKSVNRWLTCNLSLKAFKIRSWRELIRNLDGTPCLAEKTPMDHSPVGWMDSVRHWMIHWFLPTPLLQLEGESSVSWIHWAWFYLENQLIFQENIDFGYREGKGSDLIAMTTIWLFTFLIIRANLGSSSSVLCHKLKDYRPFLSLVIGILRLLNDHHKALPA